MHVVLHAMGMPFNGDTILHASLGGSESAAFYLARELKRAGHQVTVFTSDESLALGREYDGVNYIWHGPIDQRSLLGSAFEQYATNIPHDVLIVQRHPMAFHKQYQAKVCVHQMHDLALHRLNGAVQHGVWQVDAMTGVSQWHVDQMREVYGVKPDLLRVVPNGVDPELYDDAKWSVMPVVRTPACEQPERITVGSTEIIHLPRDEFLMLYQSRPERGLDHLVRSGGIMERLAREHVQVRLIVVGYDNTTPEMAPVYQAWQQMAAALPNVTYLGALDKGRLAQLQKRCDLLLYPTEFKEVSCISAMEAMHAGLPLLTSDCAALRETCAEAVELGGTKLLPLLDGKADEEAFVREVLASLALWASGQWEPLREAQRLAALNKHWGLAAERLLEVIRESLSRKQTSLASIARDAIEHSDVVFADWLLNSPDFKRAGDDGPIIETARKEIAELFAFARDPEKFKAHYALHQTKYYDEFEERVIGEDVTNTTRFRGMATQLWRQLEGKPPNQRVLDYGCAHGHYLMPLATEFKAHQFVGRDISERAIAAATKWKERAGLANVELSLGDQSGLEAMGKFDVILAGEVLEHVWDHRALLDKFAGLLNPGGCIILSTPYGRWEHSGTEAFRRAREHMHHFERTDIEETCAGMKLDMLYAPASHDRSGFGLGSWVWRVQPEGQSFGAVDYRRKLSMAAPRGSISACMIVKNGEKTLHKSVESFIDWADELIIGLDPSSSDRTAEVIAQLQGDFPYRSIRVLPLEQPVLESGFDVARNATVAAAVGEWVLWLDADEELHGPWNLHKVARTCGNDGFCYAQIHYSADPPQVLTTDYPCRLFRRSTGARFYGTVHEHPETEPGKAVPYSMMRADARFIHAGYVDEETRRKRFRRNLPLLERDMAANPERTLNRFLWLRDIAQGIMFEREQVGMQILPSHHERAAEGVKLFSEMLHDDKVHLRMIVDSLQYYSFCNETMGQGFSAEVNFKCATPKAPDMAVNAEFKGLFANREHLSCLLNRFAQESTKHYEAEYL